MAPNPSQPTRGVRDTITVLGDHSTVRAKEEVDLVEELLSDDTESAPEEACDEDDAFEEVSQATKRKAISSAPETPTAKKRHGKSKTSSPLIGIRFGEITERYMEILLLCKEEGLLNSNEMSSWEPVWDKLLDIFLREYPQFEWTKERVQVKYDIEKRRYKLFITFLRERGTSYDQVTGMVIGPRQIFKAFVETYPGGFWLCTQPLGNYDVYKEVFWREKPYRLKLGIDEEDVTTESEEGDTMENEEATTVP